MVSVSCIACRVCGKACFSTIRRTQHPWRFFSSSYVHMRPNAECSTVITNVLRTGLAFVGVSVCMYAALNSANGRSTTQAESQEDSFGFISTHEPGSVEEIQQNLAECFGSRCVGPQNERLHKLMQEAFRDAIAGIPLRFEDTSNHASDDQDASDMFPSLELSLLNDNCAFKFNSAEPIPIENDLFSGHIQINLRPRNGNDTYEMNGSTNTFEIQLQGRFKRNPNGTIYCGGELADKDFQCNVFMQGLTSALLKFLVKYIGNDLAYSFGGKDSNGRDELPNIAFPLKTAMNDVIVTPVGESPPPMGMPFVETNESRTYRKASSETNDWSLEDTYSMSFTASSIDLPTWKVLYPYDIGLSLFWGDSPLRLVIYEQGDDRDVQFSQDANNYLLALQLKFLGLEQDLDSSVTGKTDEDENQSPLSVALG